MNPSTFVLTDRRFTLFIQWSLFGLLFFLMYRMSFNYMIGQWNRGDFTYCYIIPFIVLYLIWEKRASLSKLPSVPSWLGFPLILGGIAIFLIGEIVGEFAVQYFSIWFLAVGTCWILMGWRKIKIILFPLIFSAFIIPPPEIVNNTLSFKLKLLSSKLGVILLHVYGLSAYREGNVIDLGFTQLQVVDACSGLRYVIPLFMMGLLLAYYFSAPFWKKSFVVLSTIPISVITNSFRIASVGILYQFLGSAAAEGFFHDFSGWFIFMVSLAILLLEMWLLNKISRKKEDKTKGREHGSENIVNIGSQSISNTLPRLLHPPQFSAAILLMVLAVGIAHTADFRDKTPLTKPFNTFPLQVGNWSGVRSQMEQQFQDALKLTDYLMIDYKNNDGKDVSLYVAYSNSKNKDSAAHSPELCLPGSGWDYKEAGMVSIPHLCNLKKEGKVARAFIEKNGVRQLVYYWFPQRGRILTNLYQIKLYNFWDALTRQRTDGALVRIISPVYDNETPADTEARLQGFTKEIVPVLDSFLPR